ncbi:carboxylic ester hydrolase [Elysia marginata]|uniref:Carboxylic ester hydrolase n=1 Tax=Elysia marginata TaxID=1093978 RepID=A0AAV4G7G4_9GAST|nr:carboxylic ester hydrolase [Elysia marginata]
MATSQVLAFLYTALLCSLHQEQTTNVQAAGTGNQLDTVLVSVSSGQLRGVRQNLTDGQVIHQFKGIPYAQPPIGMYHRMRDSVPDTKQEVQLEYYEFDFQSSVNIITITMVINITTLLLSLLLLLSVATSMASSTVNQGQRKSVASDTK